MNYKIYPEYLENDNEIKIEWTFKEISNLLKERANDLEENIVKYDGLIVIMSGHGMDHHIITSDHTQIDKNDIHRLFTTNKPSIRQIPRLFIYDCCDGAMQKVRHRHH